MTRFPHDEFAKGCFESLLSPLGIVQTSLKIGSEVREIDVYFQPNSQLQPIPDLGLLGQLAITNVVFEPFRNALDLLGNLKVILEARETIDPEERELVMQLSPLYLEKIRAAEQAAEARGEARMLVRLLNRRLGEVPDRFVAQIQQLTVPQLEELGEALLDFTSVADLEGWLSQNRV